MNTRKFLWSLAFTICVLFSYPALAESDLAKQDYQAYKSAQYDNSKWDEEVKAGFEAFHQNQFDVALFQLNKAFQSGCRSPIVLFQLALLHELQKSYYSSLKYYKMAEKNFQKANSNHRYAKDFAENYGRALYDSGDSENALPILKKAAKRTQSFWLLKLLGMIAYDQNDSLNATSYFERAVRIKSADVTPQELVYIYTLLGRTFLNKGEKDGAVRNYRKVLEFDPQNSEANYVVRQVEKSYEEDKYKEIINQINSL